MTDNTEKYSAIIDSMFVSISTKYRDLIQEVGNLPFDKNQLGVSQHFFDTGYIWLKEFFHGYKMDLARSSVEPIPQIIQTENSTEHAA